MRDASSAQAGNEGRESPRSRRAIETPRARGEVEQRRVERASRRRGQRGLIAAGKDDLAKFVGIGVALDTSGDRLERFARMLNALLADPVRRTRLAETKLAGVREERQREALTHTDLPLRRDERMPKRHTER